MPKGLLKVTQTADLLILGGEIIMDDRALLAMYGEPVSPMTRVDMITDMGIVEQYQNSDEGLYRRGISYHSLLGGDCLKTEIAAE